MDHQTPTEHRRITEAELRDHISRAHQLRAEAFLTAMRWLWHGLGLQRRSPGQPLRRALRGHGDARRHTAIRNPMEAAPNTVAKTASNQRFSRL